ncbi:unnamed protein product [Closterium sp. Yama58-4]|nr:unnamed protein product [Closterium sp. Yama58-4]
MTNVTQSSYKLPLAVVPLLLLPVVPPATAAAAAVAGGSSAVAAAAAASGGSSAVAAAGSPSTAAADDGSPTADVAPDAVVPPGTVAPERGNVSRSPMELLMTRATGCVYAIDVARFDEEVRAEPGVNEELRTKAETQKAIASPRKWTCRHSTGRSTSRTLVTIPREPCIFMREKRTLKGELTFAELDGFAKLCMDYLKNNSSRPLQDSVSTCQGIVQAIRGPGSFFHAGTGGAALDQ